MKGARFFLGRGARVGRPGVAPEQARQEQVDGAGEHEHRGRATKKYD
jgi:hypothetical protein